MPYIVYKINLCKTNTFLRFVQKLKYFVRMELFLLLNKEETLKDTPFSFLGKEVTKNVFNGHEQ